MHPYLIQLQMFSDNADVFVYVFRIAFEFLHIKKSGFKFYNTRYNHEMDSDTRFNWNLLFMASWFCLRY